MRNSRYVVRSKANTAVRWAALLFMMFRLPEPSLWSHDPLAETNAAFCSTVHPGSAGDRHSGGLYAQVAAIEPQFQYKLQGYAGIDVLAKARLALDLKAFKYHIRCDSSSLIRARHPLIES